jgi:hypothetical protein
MKGLSKVIGLNAERLTDFTTPCKYLMKALEQRAEELLHCVVSYRA